MKALDIPHIRLHNTGLDTSPFKSPEAVVEHLGAVQAQDFSAAKWAVGLRMQNATDEAVEKAFNEGKFLRTHVMRPTWHFIMPEDIRGMLKLTAPRVKRILAPYDPKLGITQEVLQQSQAVFTEALQGNKLLTRTELADQLEQHNIPARGQRLNHIVMHTELDAVICSGPKRGKQFTYGLLEEIVPNVRMLSRDQTLEKLTLKYFSGHGPAQVKDFAWWSGLSAKDAQHGVDRAKAELVQETVEGKTYWFSKKKMHAETKKMQAFLLSIYDEYNIGYRDRTALSEQRYFERLILMGNALTAVMVLDGKIVGTWKRRIQKDHLEVRLSPFEKLSVEEQTAFGKAADRYGRFMKLSTKLAHD